MTRDDFRRLLGGLSLGAMLAGAAAAQDALTLVVGPPEGAHATITFSPDTTGPEAAVIATTRAGVAGSRLALAVDRSATPLIERLLTEEECSFGADGSVCQVAIAGGTGDYARLVDAFRRGLVLHVEVETAGSMEMSQDVSLDGFTKAYGAL